MICLRLSDSNFRQMWKPRQSHFSARTALESKPESPSNLPSLSSERFPELQQRRETEMFLSFRKPAQARDISCRKQNDREHSKIRVLRVPAAFRRDLMKETLLPTEQPQTRLTSFLNSKI